MENSADLRPIYIVVSQTGTILSRILKLITRREYNHASISLAHDLNIMYSFGRKKPYNPFIAGFVTESASFGTFKRFSDTRVIVLETYITKTEYEDLKTLLNYMAENPKIYGYNYLGLYLAAFKICFKSHNRYYCSEFVRDTLVKYNVEGAKNLKRIVHPMNFISLPKAETVFIGKLKDFQGLAQKNAYIS